MVKPARPGSFGAMFLMYGGGMAGIIGLVSLYSAISGTPFEFGSAGVRGGVPLPSSWTAVALLLASALALYLLGTRWDAPGFSAVRNRHRWLVPVVVAFVVVPGLLVVLFAMLQ